MSATLISPRARSHIVAILLVAALILSTVLTGAWLVANRYEDNVRRADLLGTSRHDGRELGKVKGPLNILMIGSDTRAAETYNPDDPSSTQASVPGERSDTLMIIHIPKDMSRGYVVSIPRDTYAYVPESADGEGGYPTKINAAFAWGGAPLTVKAVENLTGLIMDHVVVVNFRAVREITDVVGGVEVNVDQTVTDPRTNREFTAGPNHLDGEAAEDYVRQRYGLVSGDFDRIRRQQQYLSALVGKLHETNWITQPQRFDQLMMAATSALTVDKSMPVRKLAFAVRAIRPSSVVFLTVPIGYEGEIGSVGYVVEPDMTIAPKLFHALATDDMSDYVASYPPNDVSHGA